MALDYCQDDSINQSLVLRTYVCNTVIYICDIKYEPKSFKNIEALF